MRNTGSGARLASGTRFGSNPLSATHMMNYNCSISHCLTRSLYLCFLPVFYPWLLINTDVASGKPRVFLATASASSLAVSQGGNNRLAHTHALRCTAVQRRLGQSPNDARRPRSVQQSCPPRARLSSTSTLLSDTTALPLNKNMQRINSVLLYHCRVSPALTLGLRSQPSAAPRFTSGRLGLVASGRRQSASGRRAPLAGIPPLTLLPARGYLWPACGGHHL